MEQTKLERAKKAYSTVAGKSPFPEPGTAEAQAMAVVNETRQKTFETVVPTIVAAIKEKTPQLTTEKKFPYYKIDFNYSEFQASLSDEDKHQLETSTDDALFEVRQFLVNNYPPTWQALVDKHKHWVKFEITYTNQENKKYPFYITLYE